MATKKVLWGLGIGFGAAFLLGVFQLARHQNKVIYIPQMQGMPLSPSKNPWGYRSPPDHGLDDYENVQVVAEDLTKLRGWMVYAENPKSAATIIYYHQNAGNIGFRLPFIKQLIQRVQCNVLLVAYRGYSDSEGEPTEKGLKEDGIAILDWAVMNPKIDKTKLYLYGRSLGGAVASYVASNAENRLLVKGVILENTFTSLPDVVSGFAAGMGYPLTFLLKNKWESIKEIPYFQCPILFISALKDELVRPKLMEKLIETALEHGKKVEVFAIPNGTHNETWELCYVDYFKVIKSFIVNGHVNPRL